MIPLFGRDVGGSITCPTCNLNEYQLGASVECSEKHRVFSCITCNHVFFKHAPGAIPSKYACCADHVKKMTITARLFRFAEDPTPIVLTVKSAEQDLRVWEVKSNMFAQSIWNPSTLALPVVEGKFLGFPLLPFVAHALPKEGTTVKHVLEYFSSNPAYASAPTATVLTGFPASEDFTIGKLIDPELSVSKFFKMTGFGVHVGEARVTDMQRRVGEFIVPPTAVGGIVSDILFDLKPLAPGEERDKAFTLTKLATEEPEEQQQPATPKQRRTKTHKKRKSSKPTTPRSSTKKSKKQEESDDSAAASAASPSAEEDAFSAWLAAHNCPTDGIIGRMESRWIAQSTTDPNTIFLRAPSNEVAEQVARSYPSASFVSPMVQSGNQKQLIVEFRFPSQKDMRTLLTAYLRVHYHYFPKKTRSRTVPKFLAAAFIQGMVQLYPNTHMKIPNAILEQIPKLEDSNGSAHDQFKGDSPEPVSSGYEEYKGRLEEVEAHHTAMQALEDATSSGGAADDDDEGDEPPKNPKKRGRKPMKRTSGAPPKKARRERVEDEEEEEEEENEEEDEEEEEEEDEE
jgi:hypothetical protein